MTEEPTVKVDKQGRVLDKQGRPLKDRRSRSYGSAPFKGQEGKPHPRSARLEARQESFDSWQSKASDKMSRRRPGSVKK